MPGLLIRRVTVKSLMAAIEDGHRRDHRAGLGCRAGG